MNLIFLGHLVPHSQCSLKENPKFLQNFRSKNNTLKETFLLKFLFNIGRVEKYHAGVEYCTRGIAIDVDVELDIAI